MALLTIRIVHEGQEERLRFSGPRAGSDLLRDLNERLDEVALRCSSLDQMVDWTVHQLEEQGDHVAAAI